ncbi:putative membrane protein [Microbacteriaceae bacterium SG_E_30_P1]|uniref:Membrane protein n=1 Tax=Antiquaquibacter oligotrophicus TaxID=2880260 RepID=A0ABT6KJ94_9MICO|nr:DUF1345 domain-containing protein [Antiquaquibacter oligotrophicus]MDH6179998.1 putative membrane protein [Antiquaquibacter oligotrophicus]UDF14246.1 DUF1345 domain-containing protein [Antiquaquibacter oligotrophicus]
MDAHARTPRFASDVVRGYAVLAIAVLASLGIPIVLYLAASPWDQTSLVITTLFLSWTTIGVATTTLTLATFLRADASQLRHWLVGTATRTARARILAFINGGGATSWAVTGSLIAVVAVATLLFRGEVATHPLVAWSGIAVVVSSLAMTVSSYAVRYAREYATAGGLQFPGEDRPVFSDFLYLAVMVATSLGTSDVVVTSSRARRIVLVNSLISFAFNTVVVALLVALLVTRLA